MAVFGLIAVGFNLARVASALRKLERRQRLSRQDLDELAIAQQTGRFASRDHQDSQQLIATVKRLNRIITPRRTGNLQRSLRFQVRSEVVVGTWNARYATRVDTRRRYARRIRQRVRIELGPEAAARLRLRTRTLTGGVAERL